MSVTMDAAATTEADPEIAAAPPPGTGLRSLVRLWPFVRPHAPKLILATVLLLAAATTELIIPVVVARIIDGPIARGHFAAVLPGALMVLSLGLFDAVAAWFRRLLVAESTTELEVSLRAALFSRLQALAIGRHDGWQSGQLLSRAVEDLPTIRRCFAFTVIFLSVNFAIIPIGLVVLYAMSWQAGLTFTVMVIPLIWFCVRFVQKFQVASRRAQDQSGDLATIAQESAQGVRVLKAFGRGQFFGLRFTGLARELQRTELAKVRLDATLWATLVSLPSIAIALVLAVGAYSVANGTMTMGTLVASVSVATFLQFPIIWAGFNLSDLFNARTAADRFWEIMDTPLDILDPADPVDLPAPVTGELVFDRVRFAYPPVDGGPRTEVLTEVSLRVRPGETVALVGATGSGKTALLELVPRLYDVSGGRITIDGVDIATLRLSRLRELVTVAFEEPVLFSASVRENVALGDPVATDADVHRALDIAQASDFVAALPWGLNTRIGEQGLNLSGGQRQRLALARAVLSNGTDGHRGRIMVLDDPLSALDVETEARVQERLRSVLAGVTTLLVAHRPSTAALADRVVLLAGGRVVAEGPHDTLLRTDHRYRTLMGGDR